MMTNFRKMFKYMALTVLIGVGIVFTVIHVHRMMHADDNKIIYQVIPQAVHGATGPLMLDDAAKVKLYKDILDKHYEAMTYIAGETITSADILYDRIDDFEGTLLNITGVVVSTGVIEDTTTPNSGTRLTIVCGGGRTMVLAYLYRMSPMFSTLQAGDAVTVHGYAVRRMLLPTGVQGVQVIGVRAVPPRWTMSE